MNVYDFSYDYIAFKVEEVGDLFSFLKDQGLSDRFIKNAYRKNLIRVNEMDPPHFGSLKRNDLVKIYYENENPGPYVEDSADLDIVFENENFLLVNKPAGLAVHPTFSRQDQTLYGKLTGYYKKNNISRSIHLVNRLDIETSGLILVGKNPLFQQQLAKSFIECKVKKEYFALVEGAFEREIFVDKNILDGKGLKMRRTVDPRGKSARTKLVPVFSSKAYSLIKAFPETGRTHQIRVHLAYLGHPILGDSLYGGSRDLIGRSALHAEGLEFLDPFTKKSMSFKASLPADMQILIDTLVQS